MRRASIAAVVLLAACVLLVGCDRAAPRISTHVDDWRDRVVYQIVVDRFANGDPSNDAADGAEPVPGDLSRAQGGDWRGVIDHLDYVARLGASAIWISPVVRNIARIETEDGYHGYWASDFTEHNPRFGTLEELQDLVARAHAMDIAVIVDIVPNHAGRVFAYDLDEDGIVGPGEDLPPFVETAYPAPLVWHVDPPRVFAPGGGGLETFALGAEHFHRQGIGDLGDYAQRRVGDFPTGLRDIATERDDVVEAMIETFVQWVLRTDIDGFRIDAVPHVELAFWQRFCDGLRTRLEAVGKRHFLLLGEIFELDPREIARHTAEGALDSGFDFPLKYGLIDDVVLGGAAPSGARIVLEGQRSFFRGTPQPHGVGLSPWQARVAIADNHDMPRVRSQVSDPFAVDQALVAVFTVDAIPGVYYGTEQELTGRVHHEARERLWDTGFREDLPTFALIQRLAAIRRSSIALRRGTLQVRFLAEEGGNVLESPMPDAGLLAWERIGEGERVLVVLATHPVETARAIVPTGFAPGTTLEDRLGGEATLEVLAEGTVALVVPPRTSLILFAR